MFETYILSLVNKIISLVFFWLKGVMKKYGFKGGPASHGASLSHRSPGSTGQRDAPGKVCMTSLMCRASFVHKFK